MEVAACFSDSFIVPLVRHSVGLVPTMTFSSPTVQNTRMNSRANGAADGSGDRLRSESPVRASLKWLQRALSGPARVPLSESPTRELRMKVAMKSRHSERSKKDGKHI